MSNFAIINVSISQSFCVKLKAAIFQSFNNYHGKKDKSIRKLKLVEVYEEFTSTFWLVAASLDES